MSQGLTTIELLELANHFLANGWAKPIPAEIANESFATRSGWAISALGREVKQWDANTVVNMSPAQAVERSALPFTLAELADLVKRLLEFFGLSVPQAFPGRTALNLFRNRFCPCPDHVAQGAQGAGCRWTHSPLRLSLAIPQQGAWGLTPDQIYKVWISALDSWHQHLQIDYVASPTQTERHNLVVEYSRQARGGTLAWMQLPYCQIGAADTLKGWFDTSEVYSKQEYLQEVIAHEMGHFYGLGHGQGLMQPFASGDKIVPQATDLQRIWNLGYPKRTNQVPVPTPPSLPPAPGPDPNPNPTPTPGPGAPLTFEAAVTAARGYLPKGTKLIIEA